MAAPAAPFLAVGMDMFANSSNASSSMSCEALRKADILQQRKVLLQAARESAENWADTAATISFVSIALEIVFLALLIRLRLHRAIQRAGVGYVVSLLVGCLFGHLASLIDGLPPSPTACRSRLALIYIFLYGLLAPLLGKLASLCRASHDVLLAGHTSGWDTYAQRVALSLLGLQFTLLLFYLGITAGKPTREDRLQTVCSAYVSEHAFHFLDGFTTVSPRDYPGNSPRPYLQSPRPDLDLALHSWSPPSPSSASARR